MQAVSFDILRKMVGFEPKSISFFFTDEKKVLTPLKWGLSLLKGLPLVLMVLPSTYLCGPFHDSSP